MGGIAPSDAAASETTEVGAIPQAVTIDGDADKKMMMVIPADSWFDSATVGEIIEDFNVQAKVYDPVTNTYQSVNAVYEMPYWVHAKVRSANGWMLKGGTQGHAIEYSYTVANFGNKNEVTIDKGSGTNDVNIGKLPEVADRPLNDHVESSILYGKLTIKDTSQLTAKDAGQIFKDTLTYTFTKGEDF